MEPESRSDNNLHNGQEAISEKLITRVTHRAGVLVAGGGIAGIAAALAAARHGADVLLIEREFALGGLAALGLITYYLPLCDGRGHQVIFGIGEELLRLAIKHGAESSYPSAWLDAGADPSLREKQRFKAGYNGPLFMMESEFLLKDAGVRLLYGTQICSAQTRNGRITHIICENKSGRFAVAADVFIDATGDADIARFAGAETVRFGQGNVLAGWYYSYAADGLRLKMVGASDIPDEEKLAGDLRTYLTPERFSGLDGDELSRMTELSHRATYDAGSAVRASDPSAFPAVIPSIPQIRMTRRIAGYETPDTSDDRREWDDCVGLTGHWRHRGPVYGIPLGCLRSVSFPNLLAAGRDISVTDSMWDNTRVIPTCAVTGEAAGTAAAMFSDFSSLTGAQISELRAELGRGGVKTSIAELGL